MDRKNSLILIYKHSLTPDEEDFSLFDAWLKEKLNLETMMPWGHMICFRSMNENRALGRFFEFLEEFKSRNRSPH